MYDELIQRLKYAADIASLTHPTWTVLMTEAADAIEDLGKENESLGKDLTSAVEMLKKKRKPKWIPVSERLPEEEKTVLTWGKEHQCILLDWMHDNKWCCFGDADYWMPLPESPEKESES